MPEYPFKEETMKYIFFILLIIFFSCSKEENQPNSLSGYWVNESNKLDTLLFKVDTLYRTHFTIEDSILGHKYYYLLDQDTLTFFYSGCDKVYFTKPFKNRINIDESESVLFIEGFSNVYPNYTGEYFVKPE